MGKSENEPIEEIGFLQVAKEYYEKEREEYIKCKTK